jgi:glycosyltransferase involved in cell wall biosynthesis
MKMSRLLVSGLCITANRPAFLERAVQWWSAQTWAFKELVIIDGSRKGLRLDLSARRGVRHVILDPDLDMGAKHNLALEEAQGDVLCYNDDDDWFNPRRIVRQLEPLAFDRATITGIPRDYVAYTPGARFAKFKPHKERGPVEGWIGNAIGGWKGNFHDGTALFARSVLRHGAKHAPLQVGQKVTFLNALIDKGEKVAIVRNEGLFVYVRHGGNTWQYVDDKAVETVAAPRWVPGAVVDFWRKGVA